MDHLLDEYTRLASQLRVHKRTAANIKEQLLIISKSNYSETGDPFDQLCLSLKVAIQSLQTISQLLPLQSYLRQGEISNLLDSLLKECWSYTQTSNDDFLREDIEAQREIYKSDHESDRIGVKRLLRDSLREADVHLQLSKLSPQEMNALRDAVYLERKSFTDQGLNSHATRLYTEFLYRWSVEPRTSPTSNILQNLTGKITKISAHPVAWGAICAVWTGELYGKLVSLQGLSRPENHLREYNESAIFKNARRWASFNHPNVLPLLGTTEDVEGRRLALVTPWMRNQSIEQYLPTNLGTDRLKFITEIAAGIAYLHGQSPPYVHGYLSASSVLVDDDKHAIVAGFASAAFDTSDTTPISTALDVYSFAVTALQVMSVEIPFWKAETILAKVERGEHPSRPDRKLLHHGLDDKLWALMTRCCARDPKARPSIHEMLKELENMRELPVLGVRDLTGLIRLSNDALSEVKACGAFGEIRVGVLDGVGLVALKSLNGKGMKKTVIRDTKRFFREASIWNELKHPNVLQFLGTADPPGLPTCLVSPWMENGNLINYMKEHQEEPMLSIAWGIARGLAYLHAHEPYPVIHGDLRAANVLISDTGEPLLCDFGLAVIIEDLVQVPISSILQDAGNPRWMAPELFMGEQQISVASDVWALGMVLLEIMTHDMPYCELKNSAHVILEVHNGRLPPRPEGREVVRRGLSDGLWNLMNMCWEKQPDCRPSAADALSVIENLVLA